MKKILTIMYNSFSMIRNDIKKTDANDLYEENLDENDLTDIISKLKVIKQNLLDEYDREKTTES